MGNCCSTCSCTPCCYNQGHGAYQYKIKITTGNYSGQNVNLDGKGNVCLRLYESNEVSRVFILAGSYFKRGSTRSFTVNANIKKIDALEVWIERAGNETDLNWFVDLITCKQTPSGNITIFPIRRWVTMRHELIRANDSILPQLDIFAEQRREGILQDREFFYFMHQAGGIPTMTDVATTSEKFSTEYFANVFLKQGIRNLLKASLISAFSCPWRSLGDLSDVYNRCCLKFKEPNVVPTYMSILGGDPETFDQKELDRIFGAQRLTGTNPVVIERVRELFKLQEIMKAQPSNAPVKSLEDLLKPHMEGLGLQEAIDQEKLYQVDYTEMLCDVQCEVNLIAAPIALFFVNKNNDLMPIAIQLFQTRYDFSSGWDNPIFTPTDDDYTWLLAKMWFNNADASYHQSVSHLGFTHLLMENVYIGLRQTVSISHPLYRLMAPHFLYVLNVNAVAWDLLINKGGFVDTEFSIGVKGMLEILGRRFKGTDTVAAWRFDQEGNIENDIKHRGVEKLPKYTFRDDALDLRQIIKKYVKIKVDSTYEDDHNKLQQDYEIQAWAEIMITDTDKGGCGIKGLPFDIPHGDETDTPAKLQYFKTKETLIDTITTVIYTCSVAHAAVNFLQYEEYGFPLNYPAILYGDPPRTIPSRDQNSMAKRTGRDILQALPTKQQTLATMNMTNLLSQKSTVDKYLQNQLGHFPIQYQFTEDGDTPQNVKDFQSDLKAFSEKVEKRNSENADIAYDILNPDFIPNSISI